MSGMAADKETHTLPMSFDARSAASSAIGLISSKMD
jgi:hypothetical protein